MSEQNVPLTPEQQKEAERNARLERLAREQDAADAAKAREAMLQDAIANTPGFKNLYDKHWKEIVTLNPALATVSDKKQMLDMFLPAAELLAEKEKKISSTVTPPSDTTKKDDNIELDKPLPQPNGTYKNKDGEAVDKDGNKLLAEGLSIPDYRKAEIPTDAAPAVQARLVFAKNGQNQVKRFEKPTW